MENSNGIKRTLNTVELISASISPQSLGGMEHRQVYKIILRKTSSPRELAYK
jgi:hypothetical protein